MKQKTYKSGCYRLEVRFGTTPLITLYTGSEVNVCSEKKKDETLYMACNRVISSWIRRGGYSQWFRIHALVVRQLDHTKPRRTDDTYKEYMKSDYVWHLNNLIKMIWDDPDINPWNG